jgi:hypothetical protein
MEGSKLNGDQEDFLKCLERIVCGNPCFLQQDYDTYGYGYYRGQGGCVDRKTLTQEELDTFEELTELIEDRLREGYSFEDNWQEDPEIKKLSRKDDHLGIIMHTAKSIVFNKLCDDAKAVNLHSIAYTLLNRERHDPKIRFSKIRTYLFERYHYVIEFPLIID